MQDQSWWVLAATGITGVVIQTFSSLVDVGRLTGRQDTTRAITAPVPRQLPADLPDFVGRDREIAVLRAPPARRKDAATTDIRLVYGQGGVGKTSLVVHALELGSAGFPDGQLYVDLQGYGPNPLSPAEALSGWLLDLGVDERLIPATLTERSRAFRSRMAGRRAAVFLDNAGSEEQVRPLLVAGGGCVTYITSREALGGLSATVRIPLDGLSVSESVELLSRILGKDRIQQEEQPAQQLASAFGGLPLALRVLSGRLVSEPRPLATFLARLDRRRAEGQLLSELTFGDLSVAASLALSREHLPLPTQTAFDLLGLHPADEWSDWSVAALCECSLLDAQRLLERLTGAQLVKTRTVAGTDEPRYYLHDLVREFARNQAVLNMPEESREEAVRRIASAYLAMTDLADEAIHPGGVRHQGRTQAPRYPLDPDVTGRPVSDPFGWCRLERDSIAALVAACHRIGAWSLCWELSDAASVALENLRSWDTGIRCAELALDAVRHLDSDQARAAILRNLGEVDREIGERDRAIARLEESVRLFDKVGDEYGVIDASCNLGLVQLRWGDPNAAEQIFLTALDRARKIADVRGEAWTLEILGECAMILGRRAAGVRYLQDATELFAAAGERRGEAFALSNEALLIIDDLGWLPLPALARDALPPAAEQDAHHASALLDRAEKIFDVLGDARNSALVAVARIRIKILSGRDREAAKDARRTESMEGFDLDWRLRGLLLHCEAVLAHRSGSVRSALAKCEEALSLVQPFGDRPATASMTLHAGLLRKTMGEQDAEPRVRKAQGIFREIGRADGAQLCDRILAG
ncbi:tetratricopeptide repeat protein [Nonomuraea rubra]